MNRSKHKRQWLMPLFLLAIILCGFSSNDHNYLFNSSWTLNCIRIDNDTSFFRTDSIFTFKHNFKLNEKHLKSYEDSVRVADMASKKFHTSRSMNITFISDSTFVMTKMRSGGRIFPNELDSGNYEIRNDTVHFSLITRRNYQLVYRLNRSADILFVDEKNPLGQQVYCEYTKD